MPEGRAARVTRAARSGRRLAWREWRTLAEAGVCLALVRAAILTLRFAALRRFLGTPMRESPHADAPADRAALRHVAWAIAAASRRAPWRCACLEQGVAARWMLRRRGIPCTLYLGVARGHGAGPFEAHAWLRSGATYVTGSAGRERFTVVSTFGDVAAG